ncbi:hypothetical protein ALC53_01182 [Atta colombica]|uniref:Uncharacterized protein n=1 Tax=Atta colombica TaxID=520822 RepID=A0A195BU28_9HYME|nr:hypothetical protein ALC53_01182 [Atta colombica]
MLVLSRVSKISLLDTDSQPRLVPNLTPNFTQTSQNIYIKTINYVLSNLIKILDIYQVNEDKMRVTDYLTGDNLEYDITENVDSVGIIKFKLNMKHLKTLLHCIGYEISVPKGFNVTINRKTIKNMINIEDQCKQIFYETKRMPSYAVVIMVGSLEKIKFPQDNIVD